MDWKRKYTYRDPYLSLWQSALTKVQSASNRLPARALNEAIVRPAADLEIPVHLVAQVAEDPDARPFPTVGLESDVTSAVKDCAKVAAEFLWAEITRDHRKAQSCASELNKAVCDVGGWATCLATYLDYKASAEEPVYRDRLNPRFTMPNDAQIAIVGDWGTGDKVAANLLAEVKKLGATVLVHLGDIYYSGTRSEVEDNFLNICRTVLGANFDVYTLCGNHDMYSGGEGYYWVVDQLGQQASYFALENTSWLLLAMDTGHNDNNPLTAGNAMTSLKQNEAVWLRSVMQEAKGKKKTILLSHHQLYSPFEPLGVMNGVRYGINPMLADTFGPVIDQVEWWFWGHEHNLGVYEPYMGLKRGRCVGASAVPVFAAQVSYKLDNSLFFGQNGSKPAWKDQYELSTTGDDYNHTFAMLRLKGPSATVEYFQVPPNRAAQSMGTPES